jgi:glutathione S-transferase
MLTLYYTPDTCALATHIALEEAGAAYKTVLIDFAQTEQQSAAYLKINPKARVPALVTERGNLTETPAMLAYVAQTYPKSGLAPLDDAYAFAKVQEMNSFLCSTLHVAHAHRMRGHRWSNEPAAWEAMQRHVPASMTSAYDLIERTMLAGPWMMGQAYTICDPYLFTIAQWLEEDGVEAAKFPKLIAHRQRVSERPAVRRAIAQEGG